MVVIKIFSCVFVVWVVSEIPKVQRNLVETTRLQGLHVLSCRVFLENDTRLYGPHGRRSELKVISFVYTSPKC